MPKKIKPSKTQALIQPWIPTEIVRYFKENQHPRTSITGVDTWAVLLGKKELKRAWDFLSRNLTKDELSDFVGKVVLLPGNFRYDQRLSLPEWKRFLKKISKISRVLYEMLNTRGGIDLFRMIRPQQSQEEHTAVGELLFKLSSLVVISERGEAIFDIDPEKLVKFTKQKNASSSSKKSKQDNFRKVIVLEIVLLLWDVRNRKGFSTSVSKLSSALTGLPVDHAFVRATKRNHAKKYRDQVSS